MPKRGFSECISSHNAMVQCFLLTVRVTSWFTPFCPAHSTLSIRPPPFRNTSTPKGSPQAWPVSLNKIQTNNLPCMPQIYNPLTGLPARGRQQRGTTGMNHPHLSLLTSSVKWRWEHCISTELELEEISLMSLSFLPKLLLNGCHFIHSGWIIVLIRAQYQNNNSAGEGEHETLAGRVTLADVTELPHLFYRMLLRAYMPEEPLSLLPLPCGVRAAPATSMGCADWFQLGCCCWRGSLHCHVAPGPAAGPACCSLDRCGKSSTVTVLGPKTLLMPPHWHGGLPDNNLAGRHFFIYFTICD